MVEFIQFYGHFLVGIKDIITTILLFPFLLVKNIINSILQFLHSLIDVIVLILCLGIPMLIAGFLAGDQTESQTTGQTRRDNSRKIGYAIQDGPFIYVYDENGYSLFSLRTRGGPNDGLKGYTSSTVTIQDGSFIYVYDARKRCIKTLRVRQ